MRSLGDDGVSAAVERRSADPSEDEGLRAVNHHVFWSVRFQLVEVNGVLRPRYLLVRHDHDGCEYAVESYDEQATADAVREGLELGRDAGVH